MLRLAGDIAIVGGLILMLGGFLVFAWSGGLAG